MCETCGCGQLNESNPHYGKGPIGRHDHMAMGHIEARGYDDYTKFENLPKGERMAWNPSMRALANSNGSYEEYLRLMQQYEDDLTADVDSAFGHNNK